LEYRPRPAGQLAPDEGGRVLALPPQGGDDLAVALQLQGSLEVSLLRHSLMASPPDGPRDDERRLDPALG
jgi:hypothetical protein